MLREKTNKEHSGDLLKKLLKKFDTNQVEPKLDFETKIQLALSRMDRV